ncbi:hypothetical protein EX30DRAFT_134002 [Ascodesmis nigricans]|uniref:RING-type domain-containing protein n=1 Tax=Ascodesmis nigricans TaxID=341454 RepID=A0A4V3SI44_9PEZI|nr:hypothetical protein EX30DRAFT_134002 [Ascodesmis nigricans]
MSAAGALDIETYPAVTCPGKPALSINTGRDAAASDSEPPLSAVAPSFNFKEEFTTAPPPPAPWTWTCHRCHHTYRFSAALNRCLSCSHRFCRECISEYDYDGWDAFRAYYQPESFLNDIESHGHTNYLNPCHIDDSDDEDDYSDRSISPSSSEDEHDEAISPTRISFTASEAEWLSQKALEIDNAYSPSFHDA